MERRLSEYLRQMRDVSNDAMGFTRGMTYGEFLADPRTQQAVAMSLVLLGEAANRILERFPKFTEAHPEVHWAYIRGWRNRIAHEYFELDFAIIWSTVIADLPVLVAQVQALMAGEP